MIASDIPSNKPMISHVVLVSNKEAALTRLLKEFLALVGQQWKRCSAQGMSYACYLIPHLTTNTSSTWVLFVEYQLPQLFCVCRGREVRSSHSNDNGHHDNSM